MGDCRDAAWTDKRNDLLAGLQETCNTILQLQASKPARMGTTLEVASVHETVTVTDGADSSELRAARSKSCVQRIETAQLNAASQNVVNLQRRVAGILPVRVEVPTQRQILSLRASVGVGGGDADHVPVQIEIVEDRGRSRRYGHVILIDKPAPVSAPDF